MDRYRVISGAGAKFGPGQIMQLDARQASARVDKVDVVDGKGTDTVKVKVRAPIEFKAGEVIGLPELERRLETIVERLTPDKPAVPAVQTAAPVTDDRASRIKRPEPSLALNK